MKPIALLLILISILPACDRAPTAPVEAAQAAHTTTLHFKVQGMTCEGCEAAIADAISRLSGVRSVHASHKTGTVDVQTANPSQRREIAEAIATLNYAVDS